MTVESLSPTNINVTANTIFCELLWQDEGKFVILHNYSNR